MIEKKNKDEETKVMENSIAKAIKLEESTRRKKVVKGRRVQRKRIKKNKNKKGFFRTFGAAFSITLILLLGFGAVLLADYNTRLTCFGSYDMEEISQMHGYTSSDPRFYDFMVTLEDWGIRLSEHLVHLYEELPAVQNELL